MLVVGFELEFNRLLCGQATRWRMVGVHLRPEIFHHETAVRTTSSAEAFWDSGHLGAIPEAFRASSQLTAWDTHLRPCWSIWKRFGNGGRIKSSVGKLEVSYVWWGRDLRSTGYKHWINRWAESLLQFIPRMLAKVVSSCCLLDCIVGLGERMHVWLCSIYEEIGSQF